MSTRIAGPATAATPPDASAGVRPGRRLPAGRVSLPVVIGVASLAAAIVLSLAFPPTLVSAVLGVVAVAGLSRSERLGPLPAALLALIAIPYGRAADNDLAAIAGIPLRFQDGVVLAAVALGLPSLRHASWRTGISRLISAFLVIGALAGLIALLGDNAMRDVVRDARWWALYGIGLLALWGRVDQRAVIRGLLLGVTVFAIVLVAVTILPAFEGGLETRALTYDWGRLRLQFSNSIFLIPALAYLATRVTVRPNRRDVVWLGLLAVAVVVSLTRMSILAGLGTAGLAVLWAAWCHRSSLSLGSVIRRGLGVAAILVASSAIAVGALTLGLTMEAAISNDPGSVPTDGSGAVLDRILFQDPDSSVEAIERGRFATYRSALDVIRAAPVLGGGLGTLVPIDFTFGGSEPSTPGMQPGVDDAYLTVAMKAGLIGVVVYALMMAWPLWVAIRRRRDRVAWWFLPAWLGVLGLSLTQSFATTGYGPFGIGLLLVLLDLRRRRVPDATR